MKEIANGFYVPTHAFIWQMTILQGNKGIALKGTSKPNIGYKDQRKYMSCWITNGYLVIRKICSSKSTPSKENIEASRT